MTVFFCRIKPYNCLPTGDMIGLIEVVQNAETIARIQAKSGLGGVIKDKILYEWLRGIGSSPEKYVISLNVFSSPDASLSCSYHLILPNKTVVIVHDT